MSEKQSIEQIAGPFGLDRRDSAIVKRSPGILYELENFFIHNGNIEVREGITRLSASALNATYRILALHRYYGLDANEEELKEFYSAVDGSTSSSLRKWNGSSWDTMRLPPGMTLTSHENAASGERPPAEGMFAQFKDRTYYTNQKQPVLMIKKDDSQVYEAGVPDADQEIVLQDFETFTKTASGVPAAGEWQIYTDGVADKVLYYLDGGFERHTEGDYGLTLEQSDSGKTLSAVHRFSSQQNLEWFYQITDTGSRTITTGDANGVRLTDSSATFTEAYVGLQLENVTDGSTAIITKFEDANNVLTTALSGGTNNDYGVGDAYILGSRSSEYDYLAIDIFRFTKIDIDEAVIEFSSIAPNSSGTNVCGFRCVIYTDSDFEHFSLNQRTMLAEWAMNPYSNTLFFGRFRKRWFIPIDSVTTSGSSGNTLADSNANFDTSLIGKTITDLDSGTAGTITAAPTSTTLTTSGITWSTSVNYRIADDWGSINYFRTHIQNNAQTTGDGLARMTIDNLRLLKTPPLPVELSLQVASCDPIEEWMVIAGGSGSVPNSAVYATEGIACKAIGDGNAYSTQTVEYEWTGEKDLSQYGEGTLVDGSDEMVFNVGVTGARVASAITTTITLFDSSANTAVGTFSVFSNLKNLSQRSIHIQNFKLPSGSFNWDQVSKLWVTNYGFDYLFIDHIRIQPATASKMINKFIPMDLIVFDAIARGIESRFGENTVIDTVVDWLFHAYAKFTRQVVGQGQLVYPEYTHGKYRLGESLTAASLQMQVDAGGSLSCTFIQENDLTEYSEFNFNMDAFWTGRQENSETADYFWGADWIEIPATEEDEFSLWFSVDSIKNLSHIIVRFYCNANASWEPDGNANAKHVGANAAKHLEKSGGTAFTISLLGKRIYNETQKKWGIIGWVSSSNRLAAWGLTWNTGDEFTIDDYQYIVDSGRQFNPGFKFESSDPKPKPDKNNYYEYELDIHTLLGKQLGGISKSWLKATGPESEWVENEEAIETIREMFHDYGIYAAAKRDDGWWEFEMRWKRKDFAQMFDGNKPWSSWQCIAAHEIQVRASSKNNAMVNFQDLHVRKQGAVTGEQIRYKVKLEDELGFVGAASEESKPITVKGSDVQLSDIYVPYDTRIKRKRIYRTDTTGTYRLVDTIDRLSATYLDQVSDDFLGPAIEDDSHKPPLAAGINKVDNKMAYIDCIDRRGNRRSSRIHLSLPFIPHQVKDTQCFDVVPEDGQKVIWCEWYYGHYIVWKERSIYTIDPTTYAKAPRDLTVGCIAARSVAPIPNVGFGWLSHEGIIFGDHTRLDNVTGEQIWDDLKNYTPEELSHAIGFYKDRYYFIFLGLDNGIRNTKGYACYVQNKTWFKLTGMNVQSVSQWRGGTDANELYFGTDYGYVNKMFDGEEDIDDTASSTTSQIASALRIVDQDLGRPHTDKYLNWIIFHAKNLSSDPTRKAMLTFTPYYDQQPTKALDDEQIMHDYYKKYDLCVDPGYEFNTTLVGFRMVGSRRYAIKGFTLDVTDQEFRPVQQAGTY